MNEYADKVSPLRLRSKLPRMLISALDILESLPHGKQPQLSSLALTLGIRPRLVGTVEVRSNGLEPIAVSYVSISLCLHEKITVPSRPSSSLSLTSAKFYHDRVIGKEIMLFQASNGKSYEYATALTLPFIIDLPCNFNDLPPPSLVLPGGTCETN